MSRIRNPLLAVVLVVPFVTAVAAPTALPLPDGEGGIPHALEEIDKLGRQAHSVAGRLDAARAPRQELSTGPPLEPSHGHSYESTLPTARSRLANTVLSSRCGI